MPDLTFAIVGAEALEHAATATVNLRLVAKSATPVRAIALRALVRIEVASRASDVAEAERLEPVLGPADRSVTAPLVWAQLSTNLPAFDAELGFDLHLPCSLDLRTGTATYLDALDGGAIPIALLFSGTVFHGDASGALRVAPIPWTAEARFALGVATCREALARHHGDAALLPVRREILARLRDYAARQMTPALDEAPARLLDLAEAGR